MKSSRHSRRCQGTTGRERKPWYELVSVSSACTGASNDALTLIETYTFISISLIPKAILLASAFKKYFRCIKFMQHFPFITLEYLFQNVLRKKKMMECSFDSLLLSVVLCPSSFFRPNNNTTVPVRYPGTRYRHRGTSYLLSYYGIDV